MTFSISQSRELQTLEFPFKSINNRANTVLTSDLAVSWARVFEGAADTSNQNFKFNKSCQPLIALQMGDCCQFFAASVYVISISHDFKVPERRG